MGAQATHQLAHARSRGLVKNPVLIFLQDARIILHPDDHRVHHELFDCNFCTLNGWANPVVNSVRRLCTVLGALPSDAPSVESRKGAATTRTGWFDLSSALGPLYRNIALS